MNDLCSSRIGAKPLQPAEYVKGVGSIFLSVEMLLRGVEFVGPNHIGIGTDHSGLPFSALRGTRTTRATPPARAHGAHEFSYPY